MRLIDADELIKGRIENDPVRIAAMCAPTAYDVNKVERELKNEIELVVQEFPLHGKYIKKNRAIDIVRSGGVTPEKLQSKDGKYMHDRESFFKG